jgi:hypothetical protein
MQKGKQQCEGVAGHDCTSSCLQAEDTTNCLGSATGCPFLVFAFAFVTK